MSEGERSPERPGHGAGLARAESEVETPIGRAPVDLAGAVLRVDPPGDVDVLVTCRVPFVRCGWFSEVGVELVDEFGTVRDRAGLAYGLGGGTGEVTLEELVPSGSGPILRLLRASTLRGKAVANHRSSGRITMEATAR